MFVVLITTLSLAKGPSIPKLSEIMLWDDPKLDEQWHIVSTIIGCLTM